MLLTLFTLFHTFPHKGKRQQQHPPHTLPAATSPMHSTMVLINYTLALPIPSSSILPPPPTSGSLELPDDESGAARITVANLRAMWPFEGAWHFRAQVPTPDGSFVWLDLVAEESVLPPAAGEPSTRTVRALPLFDASVQGGAGDYALLPEEFEARRAARAEAAAREPWSLERFPLRGSGGGGAGANAEEGPRAGGSAGAGGEGEYAFDDAGASSAAGAGSSSWGLKSLMRSAAAAAGGAVAMASERASSALERAAAAAERAAAAAERAVDSMQQGGGGAAGEAQAHAGGAPVHRAQSPPTIAEAEAPASESADGGTSPATVPAAKKRGGGFLSSLGKALGSATAAMGSAGAAAAAASAAAAEALAVRAEAAVAAVGAAAAEGEETAAGRPNKGHRQLEEEE